MEAAAETLRDGCRAPSISERDTDSGRRGRWHLGPLLSTRRDRIYEAWADGKRAALRISSSGREEKAAARCKREATLLARVRHPNVVRLLDHSSGHRPYVALELVFGEELAVCTKRGPLSTCDAFFIGAELLDALDAMHAAGVVHGNIAASSVILGHHGRPILISFGRAHFSRNLDAVQLDIAAFASTMLSSTRVEDVRGRALRQLLTRAVLHDFRSAASLREAWLETWTESTSELPTIAFEVAVPPITLPSEAQHEPAEARG